MTVAWFTMTSLLEDIIIFTVCVNMSISLRWHYRIIWYFQACLKPEHLPAFTHVSSDPRAQHYSKVVMTRAAGRTNRTKVRNQRYAALRALQKGRASVFQLPLRTHGRLFFLKD